MRLALIIPAAGRASRYEASGGLRHKLDEDLGGRPVLQRTIELFVKHEAASPLLSAIIVAGPHDQDAHDDFKQRYADRLGLLGVKLCKGGVTHRWETVRAALALVPDDATHIAVHDAARPCTPPELIDRVLDMASRRHAVVPVVEVSDTLKRVEQTDEPVGGDDPIAAILGETPRGQHKLRVISATVPRDHLFAVQTPQVFDADTLRRAYAQPDLASTDDAGLVENLWTHEASPQRVAVVAGDARNIKITRPEDLTIARAILGLKPPEARPTHKRF
jgi:2-C-methyl-D-erythritol 4-phosphate cytidylyltransferase